MEATLETAAKLTGLEEERQQRQQQQKKEQQAYQEQAGIRRIPEQTREDISRLKEEYRGREIQNALDEGHPVYMVLGKGRVSWKWSRLHPRVNSDRDVWIRNPGSVYEGATYTFLPAPVHGVW